MSAPTQIESDAIPGVTRVALPIGVNAIDSVNMYVLADGDKVTVVDCGVWRPDLPDGGLASMRPGWGGPGTRWLTCPGSSSRTRTSITTGWPAG